MTTSPSILPTNQDRAISIGGRLVGRGYPCYVIAEAGVNHNGSLECAKKLVDVAKAAQADAVKFQKRSLSELYQEGVLSNSLRAEQGTQYLVGVLQDFELGDEEFVALAKYCDSVGITFLCTGWDAPSIDFLDALGVPAFKMASADMTNVILLEHAVSKGKPLLVSTGMSSVQEISETVAFLKELNAQFVLLHCNSTYPAPFADLNLRFIPALAKMSGVPVGYSGHEAGIAISTAVVALGACVIERHITLDRTMRGPDHAASLEPAGFSKLVRDIRHLEAALGSDVRAISRGELLNRQSLGKSLVAARNVSVGEVITLDMIAARSPGSGLSPLRRASLIGRPASRALKAGEMFTVGDLGDDREMDSCEFPPGWGLVVRPTDIDELLSHKPRLVEIHLSDRDLDAGTSWAAGRTFSQQLAVHAPEYCYDRLIDFCASNTDARNLSLERIQRTLDYAAELAGRFAVVEGGPPVIVHVGGMSRDAQHFDLATAEQRIINGLRTLAHPSVNLLIENLPPLAWYFGGQWFQHAMTEADHIRRICDATGLGLCFDTSHAALYCRQSGVDLFHYAETLRPHIRHLHIADAAGVSGEGLQIGEGDVDFEHLLPIILGDGITVTLEIWQGHHAGGAGFATAMSRLGSMAAVTRRSSATSVTGSEGAGIE